MNKNLKLSLWNWKLINSFDKEINLKYDTFFMILRILYGFEDFPMIDYYSFRSFLHCYQAFQIFNVYIFMIVILFGVLKRSVSSPFFFIFLLLLRVILLRVLRRFVEKL